ncbi:MAG: hypothetical protein HZB75_02335 [Candidatus Saccharibacteria bacterium]|nr:MAG: hypothetical protein HZB75_02335 [Candidatus Saccharibacteria bacterium]
MKNSLRNNGLATAMFAIFAVSIVGMSLAGWSSENEDRAEHGRTSQGYVEYITSGSYIEAVFENWESEFLQMWALVILTVFLYQKGSTDSKPLRGKASQDTSSRYSIIEADSWHKRGKAIVHGLYAHSLGIALFGIFIASFALHAVGGAQAYNELAVLHGGEAMSVFGYLGTSQFWFESLQNWQSEFLAVGALLVLSIYLRERGSQQSKPVGRRYDHKTGE